MVFSAASKTPLENMVGEHAELEADNPLMASLVVASSSIPQMQAHR